MVLKKWTSWGFANKASQEMSGKTKPPGNDSQSWWISHFGPQGKWIATTGWLSHESKVLFVEIAVVASRSPMKTRVAKRCKFGRKRLGYLGPWAIFDLMIWPHSPNSLAEIVGELGCLQMSCSACYPDVWMRRQ